MGKPTTADPVIGLDTQVATQRPLRMRDMGGGKGGTRKGKIKIGKNGKGESREGSVVCIGDVVGVLNGAILSKGTHGSEHIFCFFPLNHMLDSKIEIYLKSHSTH